MWVAMFSDLPVGLDGGPSPPPSSPPSSPPPSSPPPRPPPRRRLNIQRKCEEAGWMGKKRIDR